MSYKYMRIQGREDSYITRYPKGIFSLCWNLVNAGVMDESEKEMFVCIDDWFKSHLPEPEPCVKREKVITFFKCDTTREMYEKLRPAIHLLDKSLSGRRKNMKKVPLPEWCVSVKKAMVERDDMSVTELAKEIGYSRAHVSQVINGTMVPSANIKSAIESCLNLRA